MISTGRKEFKMTTKSKITHIFSKFFKYAIKNPLFDELFPAIKQ